MIKFSPSEDLIKLPVRGPALWLLERLCQNNNLLTSEDLPYSETVLLLIGPGLPLQEKGVLGNPPSPHT